MKLLPLAALALLFVTGGCTVTRIRCNPITHEAKLWRMSFLQRVDIPELTISTNGTATLKGYRNDGGGEAAAALMKAGMTGLGEGLLKGAKGGL